MPAILTVDPRSGVPIYLQIIEQVKRSVALGVLQDGEQLPTVKQLAMDLTVNPNTVARAYLELEHAGIVTKRHGSGTYVSETRNSLPQREKAKILARRVDALLTEARQLEIELSEVIKMLRERDGLMNEEVQK